MSAIVLLSLFVMPAKAGISVKILPEIPAFAGMMGALVL
jgi:hypothetical protein